MEKDKRLIGAPDGRDWLRGKLGLVLMGRAMLSKSLIQFSVDGWSCVPSLSFTCDQTMVEVMKIMATSFKRSHARIATLSAPKPAAGHRQPTLLLETPGHSRTSLGQSLVGSLLLSPGSWCAQDFLCPPRVYFPSPSVSSSSSMVGLMVTFPKRLIPYASLLHPEPLTLWQSTADLSSAGGSQTQFYLRLSGVSGS